MEFKITKTKEGELEVIGGGKVAVEDIIGLFASLSENNKPLADWFDISWTRGDEVMEKLAVAAGKVFSKVLDEAKWHDGPLIERYCDEKVCSSHGLSLYYVTRFPDPFTPDGSDGFEIDSYCLKCWIIEVIDRFSYFGQDKESNTDGLNKVMQLASFMALAVSQKQRDLSQNSVEQ